MVFFYDFHALSEDQEEICRIHQNYLVALRWYHSSAKSGKKYDHWNDKSDFKLSNYLIYIWKRHFNIMTEIRKFLLATSRWRLKKTNKTKENKFRLHSCCSCQLDGVKYLSSKICKYSSNVGGYLKKNFTVIWSAYKWVILYLEINFVLQMHIWLVLYEFMQHFFFLKAIQPVNDQNDVTLYVPFLLEKFGYSKKKITYHKNTILSCVLLQTCILVLILYISTSLIQ